MAVYKGTDKVADTFGIINNLTVTGNSCVCGNETIDGTLQAAGTFILPTSASACIGAIWLVPQGS